MIKLLGTAMILLGSGSAGFGFARESALSCGS